MSTAKNGKKINIKRLVIVTITGIILGIALILVTLELSHRNVIPFLTNNQKYIIGVETAGFGVFLTEILARVFSVIGRKPEIINYGKQLRLIVRILGYTIVGISIISILAANPVFAISIGSVAGVAVAFATQNALSNVLATIMLLNSSRMVRVGEQVTISGITGTVTDINITHTTITDKDDVIFVPNSMMMSATLRRAKRTGKIDQLMDNL